MATQSYVQKVRSGRLVQPFGYAAGTVVTNPVTLRGPVYTEWYLRLRGTLTSSAAIAAANVNPGDEWAVVNRVRLLAGSEVLFDYTGEELKWWNYRMYGVPPRQGMAFGAGPTVIDSSLTIPFWDLRSAKPIEVAFNSGAYTTLTLEVTWGDETSISTLGTILANASLDV